jgi:RNA polymerase sigma-70 factor (ECF subfamily)
MAAERHASDDLRMEQRDPESAEWLRKLGHGGRERHEAVTRLHELLLRVARSELQRRNTLLRITGPELDDLAFQAAGDAVIAINGKLAAFRGESRFTTWAYMIVVREVSNKLGRHFWQHPEIPFDAENWDRLPDAFCIRPDLEAETRDLVAALRRAVDEQLTERQRRLFVALVLNGVPLDTLVIEYHTNRNAIYKTMFDARRKLRAALVAGGYLDDNDDDDRRRT